MELRVYNYKTHQEAIKKITELDFKNKVYNVKIINKIGKRSIDQNSLYWMWLTCIEQETGNDKNDLHFHFRGEYLGVIKKVILGLEKYDLKSTTKLNTSEFKQYLDKIQIFANTELGINLPNPEDKKFEDFKSYYSKFI